MKVNLLGIGLLLATPVYFKLAWSDYRTKRLPNALNLTALLLALISVCAQATLDRSVADLSIAVVSAFAVFFFFLVLFTVTEGGLGGGDVKLAPSIALFLSYKEPLDSVVWIVVTFVVAGFIGLNKMVVKRTEARSSFALGPVMISAFWLILLTR